ncbi:helix-turn-helix domain-containing protein [Cetobacterium sp. ZOR0034]|uniref:helix-turn-helix domain-containing protein n=1 Tax=Cetobacterium sp. ZOR0034 TaxID=1339239 RepID=UPI00064569B8|nr:helix-turn-helix transcriptional regulator [Cetobacterium sp. ZOR0034]
MKAGDYLKLKRNEKKLSLRQMAYKTGLSHTYISDIEKGSLMGTTETHEKIMESLNLSSDEKQFFYNLLIKSGSLPKYIEDKIYFLETENELLRKELEECKNQLNIESNSNNGHIIVGDGNKINHSYAGTELCKEMNELSEIQKEKVLKFINEYIK